MRLLFALFIILALLAGSTMAKEETTIYGYVEKVTLLDKDLTLSAKLDTGAKSASLHATHITPLEIKGIPYLRFTVPNKGEHIVFECEYIGKVKIKVRYSEIHTEIKPMPMKRPVVLMNIKLGNKVRAIQVNLTNRKRFLYPLLLGRDAIIDFNGAIDPARTFTTKLENLKK